MKTVVIGADEYIIKSILIDEYIILTPLNGAPIPTTGLIFDIPVPVYRHGTPMAINAELTTFVQKDKTPFVWHYELINETNIVNPLSNVCLESDVILYILDEADPENMLTENHYAEVIRPLKQLSKELVKSINNKLGKYIEVLDYDTVGLADWGEFNSIKGFQSKILDEKWSGIKMSFFLRVRKNNNCQ